MRMPEAVANTQNLEFNERFTEAYDLLENSRKYLFITGRAGTGKSTLLQYFRQHTLKKAVVLAPTGVAAVNIKGQTIHSFFRFKPDTTPDTVTEIRMYKSKQRIYQELDAIVIDEISMVRADLLDCVDIFLRLYGRDHMAPFGGVQMIFFGDPYQLPPVVRREEQHIFKEVYASPYFFDAHVFKEIDIETVELQKVYRQHEADFIRLLNTVRDCTATDADMQQLNTRYQPSFIPPKDEVFVHLTTTNQMADVVNKRQLQRISGELHQFEGTMKGEFKRWNLPTQERLALKESAQVMLLNNDPEGRWINGSVGKVLSIERSTLASDVIEVELDNGSVVDVEPFTWEMYRYMLNEETKAIESESVGSFKQYPLRLAWAVTMHKSQGKTFSNVIVDVGRGTFAHGQLYVALSRCQEFDRLYLKSPLRRNHIILDPSVTAFMQSS